MNDPELRPLLVRRLDERQLIGLDAFVALVYTFLMLALTARGEAAVVSRPVEILVIVLMGPPLALRRLWPVPVFTSVLVMTVLAIFLELPGDSFSAAAYALYPIALAAPRRRWIPTSLIGMMSGFVLIMGTLAGPSDRNALVIGSLLIGLSLMGGSWTLGRAVRERRAYAARAVRQQTDQAVTDERLRIARELHDVVAHSMSLIAVKAGVAVHVAEARPQEALDALRIIEDTSRNALTEMRHLLGVLRTSPPTSPTGFPLTDLPDAKPPGPPGLPGPPGTDFPPRSRPSAAKPRRASRTGDTRATHPPAGTTLASGAEVPRPAGTEPAQTDRRSADAPLALAASQAESPRRDDAAHATSISDLRTSQAPTAAGANAGSGLRPYAASPLADSYETSGPNAPALVEEDLAPVPGLAGLSRLVDTAAMAGVRVDLRLQAGELPEGVALAVYRIVQEALTNVVKHAAPARSRVVIEQDAHEVRVAVTDDGPGVRVLPGATPGHGLIGMRERAMMYGGDFSAGPRPEGGFAVSARLPYDRSAS